MIGIQVGFRMSAEEAHKLEQQLSELANLMAVAVTFDYQFTIDGQKKEEVFLDTLDLVAVTNFLSFILFKFDYKRISLLFMGEITRKVRLLRINDDFWKSIPVLHGFENYEVIEISFYSPEGEAHSLLKSAILVLEKILLS